MFRAKRPFHDFKQLRTDKQTCHVGDGTSCFNLFYTIFEAFLSFKYAFGVNILRLNVTRFRYTETEKDERKELERRKEKITEVRECV